MRRKRRSGQSSGQALTGHVPSVEKGIVHRFGCEDLTYFLEASDRAPFPSQR
jgi:hypothetical protein